MLKLLGRATSGNVQKVVMALEEILVPYTRLDYGRQFGNTNTDEYRALNPNAKVPTLLDGDLAIWESHTILRYLSAIYAPALHGNDPKERTFVERWMDWLLATLNGPYVAVFKDSRKPESERSFDFPMQVQEMNAALSILDGHLTDKEWIALDRFTLADIALAPIVARCLDFPVERPPFSGLTAWRQRVSSRSSFQVATGIKESSLAKR